MHLWNEEQYVVNKNPGRMILELRNQTVMCLNEFLLNIGLSDTLRPQIITAGINLDHKKYWNI